MRTDSRGAQGPEDGIGLAANASRAGRGRQPPAITMDAGDGWRKRQEGKADTDEVARLLGRGNP